MHLLKYALPLSLFFSWSYPVWSQEPLAYLELEPPRSGGHYSPQESLSMQIPPGTAAADLKGIFVELNNIDVSALLVIEDGRLHYRPVQPLAAGTHELRVVYYGAEGEVRELGYWSLTVRAAAQPVALNAEAHFDLALTQRLAERNMATGQPEILAHGSGNWQSSVQAPDYRIDATGDVFYASEREQVFGERLIDMDNFAIGVRGEQYGLNLGNQQLDETNLVFDGYLKRGVSASAKLPSLKGELQVFGISSQQLYGMTEGLGVSDGDNRTLGAGWRGLLTQSKDSEIQLASSYLRGRRSTPGFAFFDNEYVNQVNEGEAWNLTLDSYFHARQWRIRLEGARAAYDFDGLDTGFEKQRDGAYSALVTYSPTPETGSSSRWSAGAEATQVGTYFHSIANPHLAADKAMERVFGSWAGSAWFGEASLARQENNLDKNLALATTEIQQQYLQLGYRQQAEPDKTGLMGYLGLPVYTLTTYTTAGTDIFTPLNAVPTDYEARGATLAALFNHQRWSWTTSYGVDTFDDNADQQIDTRTESLSVGANLALTERFQFNASWQLQTTLNRDYDTESKTSLYSIGTNFTLIPARLYGNIQAGLNGNKAVNDPFFERDEVTRYYSGELSWRIREAGTNRAGFELGLSFSSMDYRNHIATLYNQQGHQVMLTFRTSLPASYSRGF